MSYLNSIENTTTPPQQNNFFANIHQQKDLTEFFNDSEAIAALTCAEFLRHPKLEPQLLDNLLTQALRENLLQDEWFVENTDSIDRLIKPLLAQAKNTLEYIYTQSKSNDVEFSDFVNTTHEECDYDLLKFVTNIYSNAYLREVKRIIKSTNDLQINETHTKGLDI